jgi:DNA-directed RNA polymerase subunit RPC12/RpoP
VNAPGPDVRYRCNACGNLTRFDIVRRARTREFWHFSLGGDATIEESETLEEDVERVECRWCGSKDQIEQIPRVAAEEQA